MKLPEIPRAWLMNLSQKLLVLERNAAPRPRLVAAPGRGFGKYCGATTQTCGAGAGSGTATQTCGKGMQRHDPDLWRWAGALKELRRHDPDVWRRDGWLRIAAPGPDSCWKGLRRHDPGGLRRARGRLQRHDRDLRRPRPRIVAPAQVAAPRPRLVAGAAFLSHKSGSRCRYLRRRHRSVSWRRNTFQNPDPAPPQVWVAAPLPAPAPQFWVVGAASRGRGAAICHEPGAALLGRGAAILSNTSRVLAPQSLATRPGATRRGRGAAILSKPPPSATSLGRGAAFLSHAGQRHKSGSWRQCGPAPQVCVVPPLPATGPGARGLGRGAAILPKAPARRRHKSGSAMDFLSHLVILWKVHEPSPEGFLVIS